MDDRSIGREHRLNVIDRKTVQVTGINKVVAIEEQQIILITDVGKMIISGKDLHAGKLDVTSGILDFSGIVNGISYVEHKTAGQKASGIVGRLFK